MSQLYRLSNDDVSDVCQLENKTDAADFAAMMNCRLFEDL